MKKLLTCLLVFCSIQYAIAQSCADGSSEFADMVTIFGDNGCLGCHGMQGGLNLSDYTNVITGGTNGTGGCGPYADPISFIIGKADGTLTAADGCGNAMPNGVAFGTVTFDAAEVAAIEAWRDAGAPEFCPVPPANDLCADAIPLTVDATETCVPTSVTNVDATDSGEAAPTCASYSGGDAWYSVTVPASGNVTVETNNDASGTVTDTGMSLYSGACGALTQIECDDDDSADGLFSLVELTGQTPGDVIYVRVWEFGNNAFGTYSVCAYEPLPPPPPPANDMCADAVAIPVNADLACGTVTNGTIESATDSGLDVPPEDNTVCAGTEDDDVWYSFVATSTDHQIDLINVTGSTTDLYHSVWEGSCGALTNIICSDPNTSTLTGLTPGTTYYVRVYTWTATAGQDSVFDICIGTPLPPPPPPANDLCADAIELTVGEGTTCTNTIGTNESATDSGEAAPSCASYTGGDTWYTVTVPANGEVTVETTNAGGFTDSGMSIYSGTCGALTEIECDDDDSPDGLFSLVALTGQTPGDVLYVRVWEFGNNAFGEYNICAYGAPDGAACTLQAPPCNACPDPTCDVSTTIDLTTGTAFNDSQEFSGAAAPVQPDYDNVTNMGTLTLPAGGDQIFTAAGVSGLTLPDVISEVCLTADINVISGEVPFLFEFRIENGVPGQQLQFNATVDGTGMCSIGGNLADGVAAAGFTFVPGASYTIAAALADFDGTPVTEDIVVEISNISLTVCAPDPALSGCTDPTASNFDPAAQCDDGSCIFTTTCTLASGACSACDGVCQSNTMIDFTTGSETFNDAGEFSGGTPAVAPNYDAATNTGTFILPVGSDEIFAVAGVRDLDLPDDVTDVCYTADINVVSGTPPINIEFRIENAANPGEQIAWNATVDGTGTCSIGGSLADGTPAGGWAGFTNGALYTTAFAVVSFGAAPPLTEQVEIEISNWMLSVCAADPGAGCTDPTADNYDPNATCDDGSCVTAPTCPDCAACESPNEIPFANPDGVSDPDFSFDGGGAFDDGTQMVILAGSNNTFAGHGWFVDQTAIPADAANGDYCIFGDFNVIADPADLPITIEFRIENNGIGSNINFNTVITTSGPITLGGNLLTGTEAPVFDITGMNPALIVAIADFDGTAPTQDVIVEYSNVYITDGTCTPATTSASTISTTDPTRICIDGVGDPINVSIDVDGGGTGTWVITDAAGIILALPPAPPFDLDGAGAGQCLIWYVNSDDADFAPMVGDDAAAAVAASSCAFLSNPITVDRIEVTAPAISTTDPTTICIDGVGDPINVSIDDAGIGANSAWVITDAAATILALPPGPPFDLDGAGPGQCLIWLVNFEDPNFAPAVGDDAAALVADATCAVLSNPITVDRIEITAPAISTTDPTIICADDGIPDPINVSIDDAGTGGTTTAWVITDATGTILALPPAPPFDLEGAGGGTCLIWLVSTNDPAFAPAVGEDATAAVAAATCATLSNPITVTRQTDCAACTAAAATISTTDPTTICIDGVADPINVTLDDPGMGDGVWVITDAAATILALPPGPPFDLDGAGAGQCLIWYVNSDDADFAPMVGDDAAAAVAASSCAFLSNPITVDRIEITAPAISTTDPTTICADDGIPDPINVSIDDAGTGGTATAWVITDAAGTILALPPGPPFDLEGAGAGTCLIWLVSTNDPNFAPAVGDDATAAVAAATCATLSNPIAVEREINCGVCEEEITYDVSAPNCDMTGAFIELLDAAGANVGTIPLGSDGGAGTFGVQPCGDYSIVITGAPACYTDGGGDVGPRTFTADGTGTVIENFTFPIENIPTVGEWGLIILGLLMSITAVVGIRQRREEEVYS